MTGLEKLNKQIYDTYHDKRNKEVLPIVLVFSVIAIIFKNPLFWEILIWGFYWVYCSNNNEKLNKDPQNLKNREFLLDFRKNIISGECKFKED